MFQTARIINFYKGKYEDVHLGINHINISNDIENELGHVADEKVLGVTFDSELSFEDRISMKVNKANAIVGLIRIRFLISRCAALQEATFVVI